MAHRRRRSREASTEPKPFRPPLQEQLLIDQLPELAALPVERVLCTSVGRGQFAKAAAAHWPTARVLLHLHDLYYATEAGAGDLPENLEIECSPDFPDEEVDLFAIPVRSSGDAELVRDRLQGGHQQLRIGGRMMASTDNATDEWLHDELQKLFPKVTRKRVEMGTVYLATKTEPLKKLKNFEARFALRDQDQLIQLVSRPGVFSHRRVDAGARALLKSLVIKPKESLLDLGTGCGTIALAAARRSPNSAILAVDADVRAVQCTQLGAELNGLPNVQAALNCTGDAGEPDSFDIVTANPPYFSQYQIADLFLQAAARALKPGGRVYVVTKTPNWYEQTMPLLFDKVVAEVGPSYTIMTGRKPRPTNRR